MAGRKSWLLSEEMLLSALAGIIFALSTWGMEGMALAEANGLFPWLKFSIGFLPSVLFFVVFGYLNTKLNNLVFKLMLWIVAAMVIGWMVTQVNFYIYPRALGILKPEIANALMYVIPGSISKRLFVITVMSGIFLIIGGLLMEGTLEAIRFARGIIATLIAVVFWLTFFVGAGYVTDSNYNEELRDPVLVLNKTLDEVSKIDFNIASDWTKQMMQRYTKLEVDLTGPRKIVVAEFDESFSLVRVLVDFGETWAQCSVTSTHVSNCKRIDLPK